MCLSQSRTRMFNVICRGLFYAQLRWEVIVRFVDIGESDDHHCLNFLFIIQIGVIRDRIYFTGTPYFTLCWQQFVLSMTEVLLSDIIIFLPACFYIHNRIFILGTTGTTFCVRLYNQAHKYESKSDSCKWGGSNLNFTADNIGLSSNINILRAIIYIYTECLLFGLLFLPQYFIRRNIILAT